MSKLLATALAAVFAVVTVSPVAFAQEKKEEMKAPAKAPTTAPTKAEPTKESPVAKACKGKKPGDVVKVDGKDVKCPAPAAAKK
jgi:transcription elongation GreA/GreB family factor